MTRARLGHRRSSRGQLASLTSNAGRPSPPNFPPRWAPSCWALRTGEEGFRGRSCGHRRVEVVTVEWMGVEDGKASS
eukprot:409305-Rhodomonas_salina.2